MRETYVYESSYQNAKFLVLNVPEDSCLLSDTFPTIPFLSKNNVNLSTVTERFSKKQPTFKLPSLKRHNLFGSDGRQRCKFRINMFIPPFAGKAAVWTVIAGAPAG